jgi:plastocyanin
MSRCDWALPLQALWSAAFLLTLAGVAVAALPDAEHIISQSGRQFRPGSINLHPGEHVTIVNDDSDLIHHAYIDAPDLSYDSGDQEPGDKAVITFPKDGDFLVLCGIHPKMKLAVHVQ